MIAARAAVLCLALALPALAHAQSFLGQSRPGGPQGSGQGGAQAPAPATAPLAPVQILPLPNVATPGAAQQAQPMPAPQPGQAVAPPATPAQATPAQATPAQAAPAQAAPAPATQLPSEWLPQGTAELRGIDKVTARTSPLTAKVGETVRFGPLSVTVRACAIRPPDRPADATAFLEITEGAAPPLFRGWMILSQPQLAVVEHPTHDIRLYACRP